MVELQLGRQKWAGEANNATFWPDPGFREDLNFCIHGTLLRGLDTYAAYLG